MLQTVYFHGILVRKAGHDLLVLLDVLRCDGELGPGHLQGGGTAGGLGEVSVPHQGVRRSHCRTWAGPQLVWKPRHHGELLSVGFFFLSATTFNSGKVETLSVGFFLCSATTFNSGKVETLSVGFFLCSATTCNSGKVETLSVGFFFLSATTFNSGKVETLSVDSSCVQRPPLTVGRLRPCPSILLVSSDHL